MQYLSDDKLKDLLQFVLHQTDFVIETTLSLNDYHGFLISRSGMVLFNSTCMCLQTIGECIKKIDNQTDGNLFSKYPSVPWKQIIGMRNIISHDYLSIDVELVFDIVRSELPFLKNTIIIILEKEFS